MGKDSHEKKKSSETIKENAKGRGESLEKEEKEAVKVETTNKETVKSENKKEVKKVKTGDNANIIGLMMLLVSSMFVMVFVRKKEN